MCVAVRMRRERGGGIMPSQGLLFFSQQLLIELGRIWARQDYSLLCYTSDSPMLVPLVASHATTCSLQVL